LGPQNQGIVFPQGVQSIGHGLVDGHAGDSGHGLLVAARDTNENATMLIAAWSQRKERIGETILSFAWVPQMPMHHHMLCCAYGIIIFCLYQVAIYKGGLAHFQTHPYLRFAIYRIVVTGDACFG